ncbi:MAG: hypothetical protein GY874_13085 [Desulfobacteraceae bacterium]|nr:hypothetical protein [Desulfobacteraceae bacterium]
MEKNTHSAFSSLLQMPMLFIIADCFFNYRFSDEKLEQWIYCSVKIFKKLNTDALQ